MQKDSAIRKINAHRLVLLATLTVLILILLLHFPFDGYANEYSYSVPSLTACPKGDLIQKMRELGAEEFNKAVLACQDDFVTKELPISDWRSNGAPIYWFASPVHALVTALAILTIGLVWFFSVRPKRASS
ncbi:hypothetical protein I5R92_26825 [Pseudomonas carnis]|uniref:Uncharacterized protein n=1 Tax=Pseudomonas paracarnis TaxID=2750625 RepID=A0ABU6BRA0_9PSED|nr:MULTISPECIES: hypothetical protein [Pseudomonas]MBH3370910.1 hypothetical protein [Pseudomonas carnis]MEB3782659.1 hypothetical protein [Pseudomonas paracarnis]